MSGMYAGRQDLIGTSYLVAIVTHHVIVKGPTQILEGPSMEIHDKFSSFWGVQFGMQDSLLERKISKFDWFLDF